jgi:hypothetical protein
VQIVGAYAGFEEQYFPQQATAGLNAARKWRRIGGRRSKLTPNQQDEIVGVDDRRMSKKRRQTVERIQ